MPFSRWSQENFFKYMMEHYGIDKLIDYQAEKMDESIMIVNPCERFVFALFILFFQSFPRQQNCSM
jgi:hypothetical protein